MFTHPVGCGALPTSPLASLLNPANRKWVLKISTGQEYGKGLVLSLHVLIPPNTCSGGSYSNIHSPGYELGCSVGPQRKKDQLPALMRLHPFSQ